MIQLSAIHHHQSSFTISHPSSTVIHHVQSSIIIKYRSSSGIHHHSAQWQVDSWHHLESSIIIISIIFRLHKDRSIIIAKWYSYQPSISNPSPSIIITYRSSSAIHHHPYRSSWVIHHHHPSSTVIHHHHISIIFSHPSSSNIDHLMSSIITKYRSSSGIHHHHLDHQSSIIIKYRSSSGIHHHQISIIISQNRSSSFILDHHS